MTRDEAIRLINAVNDDGLLIGTVRWNRQEREVLAYLIEENWILRAQLGGRRLRLTDDDRRRLAVRAFRSGRQALRHVATIVTPDNPPARWQPTTGCP